MDEDDEECLSPTEYLKEQCFPLKDYQLVKIYDYHIKIMDELGNINKGLPNQKALLSSLDDSEESRKMRRRANEFSVRFSRNHLYPLRRETRQVKAALGKIQSKELLQKKITMAYQTALQALQSFVSYMSQNIFIETKLREFIKCIKDLHEVCENVLLPIQQSVGQSSMSMLPKSCDIILENLMESRKEPIKERKVKKRLKKPVESGLSMYEPKATKIRFGEMVKARLKKKPEVKNVEEVKKEEKEVVPNSVRREVFPKRTREEVMLDEDVETEVQRLKVAPSKAKAIGLEAKPSKPRLRLLIEEALSHLDVGEEDKAIEKIKEITLADPDEKKQEKEGKNVGFFVIKSEIEELPEPAAVDKETQMSDKKPAKPVESRKLIVKEDVVESIKRYKDKFDNEASVKNKKKSWHIISRLSDGILDEILDEILDQVVDDDMIEALWQNECEIYSK